MSSLQSYFIYYIKPLADDVSPPKLLAFCSVWKNTVTIHELDTNRNYSQFNGAQIRNRNAMFGEGHSWPIVKEIPSTRLLVSLHHYYLQGVSMEIFDLSTSLKAKQIYKFEEMTGSKLSFHVFILHNILYQYRVKLFPIN